MATEPVRCAAAVVEGMKESARVSVRAAKREPPNGHGTALRPPALQGSAEERRGGEGPRRCIGLRLGAAWGRAPTGDRPLRLRHASSWRAEPRAPPVGGAARRGDHAAALRPGRPRPLSRPRARRRDVRARRALPCRRRGPRRAGPLRGSSGALPPRPNRACRRRRNAPSAGVSARPKARGRAASYRLRRLVRVAKDAQRLTTKAAARYALLPRGAWDEPR